MGGQQPAPQQASSEIPTQQNAPTHMMPDGSMMPGPAQPGMKPAQPVPDPMQMQQMQAQMLRQGPPQGGMPPMMG